MLCVTGELSPPVSFRERADIRRSELAIIVTRRNRESNVHKTFAGISRRREGSICGICFYWNDVLSRVHIRPSCRFFLIASQQCSGVRDLEAFVCANGKTVCFTCFGYNGECSNLSGDSVDIICKHEVKNVISDVKHESHQHTHHTPCLHVRYAFSKFWQNNSCN